MLEIIALIAVVRAFYRTAINKRLNGVVWGFIGLFSYLIPVLFVWLYLMPTLVKNGSLNIHSEAQLMLYGIVFNLLAGIAGCLIAWNTLKRQPEGIPSEESLLDKRFGSESPVSNPASS